MVILAGLCRISLFPDEKQTGLAVSRAAGPSVY